MARVIYYYLLFYRYYSCPCYDINRYLFKINMLRLCNTCKEVSIKIKVYTRKRDNTRQRMEYCLNKGKGCDYFRNLPFYNIEQLKEV